MGEDFGSYFAAGKAAVGFPGGVCGETRVGISGAVGTCPHWLTISATNPSTATIPAVKESIPGVVSFFCSMDPTGGVAVSTVSWG